jgi:hypothetical protein
VIDGRANILYPVEENEIFSMFQGNGDLRLKITDSTLFPTRQVIEEHFRRIVKYRHTVIGVVDKNGVEISVEEQLIIKLYREGKSEL